MDLNLGILRQINTPISAVGEFSVQGKTVKDLYSLEDTDRGLVDSMPLEQVKRLKVQDQTAIAVTDGKPYRLIIDRSERFSGVFGIDMYMILLVDPKGFSGVRIHPGNTSADVRACIATGKSKAKNFVGESRVAYMHLLLILSPVMGFHIRKSGTMPIIVPKPENKTGEVYLDIKRNYTL